MNLLDRILLVSVLLSTSIAGPAALKGQDRGDIDSLLLLLPAQDDDSIKANIHLKLFDAYNLYGADTAQTYLIKAEQLNQHVNSRFLAANINARKADVAINEGKLDSGLYYLERSLPYFESTVDYTDPFSVSYLYGQYYSLITVHYMRGAYEEALRVNQQGIDLLHKQESKDEEWSYDLAKLYHLRGVTFYHSELPSKAKEYMSKALEVSDNPIMIGHASKALAVFYQEEGKLDSAEVALKHSIEACEKTDIHHVCFTAHAQLGSFYRETKRFDLSKYHYEEGLRYAKLQNSIHAIMNSYQGMSNLQSEMGDYRGASISYGRLEELYQEYPDLDLGANFYRIWAEVEEELGRYDKATMLFKKFITNRDSTVSIENRQIVSDLEAKYQLAEKDIALGKERLLVEQRENQRNLFVAGSGMFALLGFFFWQRARKNKLLFQQNDFIKDQKIQQLEQEKKILSMNAMIEGQEAERTRIAKDLHDGLGGLLSTVKAHFSNIQSEIKQLEGLKVYDKAQEMMDEACDEVRRISHNLMPGALRLEGLKSAVEQLGEEMTAAHPFSVNVETVNFHARLEESKEVFVFRIIQEAMNNIIKHADAKEVLIQMSETADQYHFIIEDDGIGFDRLQIKSGLGLKSIQSRIDFINGNFDIDTREQVGTTITFSIPKETM